VNRNAMPHGHYIIRGGVAGRERLRVLPRAMAPATMAFLARIGIIDGARCLDVGCGGGGVTLELVRLAGPHGRVVGIDPDAIKLKVARAEARKVGVRNVDYFQAVLGDLGERSAFDVAYARFLLSHLPDPAKAVRTLGHLRCHDFDGCAEFWGGVASGTPAPQPCRQCPDQPLWSGTTGSMLDRTSAQRVAAVGRS
jgi:SAM-dependent methyltransferase